MRRRTSRIFSLWPRPEGLGARGGVPMGLHMALSRPDEELYSDPTATRALVSVSLPCPRIPPVVGWSVVALAQRRSPPGGIWVRASGCAR